MLRKEKVYSMIINCKSSKNGLWTYQEAQPRSGPRSRWRSDRRSIPAEKSCRIGNKEPGRRLEIIAWSRRCAISRRHSEGGPASATQAHRGAREERATLFKQIILSVRCAQKPRTENRQRTENQKERWSIAGDLQMLPFSKQKVYLTMDVGSYVPKG